MWESLKITGNESNACVELHSDSSCGGEFTQFRPGYPHLHDLWYWGLGQDAESTALHAAAVSKCGVFCNKTIPDIKPYPRAKANSTNKTNPGRNIVTIYDFFGYYGKF